MKLLSLCMIVKNEEKVLGRCLDSVKDIVDEIIIVDTGSTDKTREIALEYGAQIYDFEWINDFSAAKNEALRHATSKWILVLDADEYLNIDETQSLKDFLQTQKPRSDVAFNMSIINFTGNEGSGTIMESSADRLFANRLGIRFIRPIHEQLESSKTGTIVKNQKIPFRIYHSGYLTETMKDKNKYERNMNIFNEYKKDHPFDAYDHFTIGNEYQAIEEYDKAIEHYELSLNDASSDRLAWYPYAVIALINTYYSMNNLSKSWEWIEKELIKFKDYPEYHSLKAAHYEWFGYFDEAEDLYKQAMKVAEKKAETETSFWLYSPRFGLQIPLERLIDIATRFGRSSDTVPWIMQLLTQNKSEIALLIRFLEILAKNDSTASIIKLLSKLYDENNYRDNYLLFEASLTVGNIELANYYIKYIPDGYSISYANTLRMYILNNNLDEAKSFVKSHPLDTSDLKGLRELMFLALISQEAGLIQSLDLPKDHEGYTLKSYILHLIDNSFAFPEDNGQDFNMVFLAARDLFLLKQFDFYDQLVTMVNHPELINMLANYFFRYDYMDIAMQYYSLLLSKNQLNTQSLQNLGFYHSKENIQDEAVLFLTEAVTLEPNRLYLYPTLIKNASLEERPVYISQFKENLGTLVSVPFLNLS